jgi:hypothetical protein
MGARRRLRLPAPAICAGPLAVLCCLLSCPAGALPSFSAGPLPAGSVPQTAAPDLSQGRNLAPGVTLYHVTDPSPLDPPAPISIWILRVDPAAADLRAALANDEVMETERVADIAARHGAVAAINAGFFLPNGDPAGIYKLGGRLVSDTRRPRGAVGLVRQPSGTRLIFGRVTARMSLVVRRSARRDVRLEIAGVDTTRRRGQLMLFTPAYHAHTDTAPGGLEWILDGRPLRVREPPRSSGKTPIPKAGFVLSFGGSRPPPPLAALRPGSRVDLETHYGPAADRGAWADATDIIGGAGLLASDGRFVDDWAAEAFTAGFAELRHPRTAIGTRPDGSIWLVTVDGRQPRLSAGMTRVELREFARRLGLTNVLNLDGGGSTTMWAAGEVVNSPSDLAGPRKVSDALLVVPR